jgi:hypothetical protein
MTTANNAPISFRLADDELELLRQHQEDGEKSLNLTAKRLLLNTLGVDAKKSSLQLVNTVDTNQIKELIETAVQEKLENLTIAGVAEQFNGLLEEVEALKKQMEALKSVPPEQLNVECDRTDSDLTSDTQLIPDPNKNQIENIRTTLKRKGVQPITNDQIRKAFSDAGWDGKNYQELRQAVIDSLSRQNNDKVP